MSAPQISFHVPLKSVGVAYLWWLLLGALGAHKFYMGRPAIGVLYACTLGLFWIGLLYDLFTMPSQVRASNEKLMGLGQPTSVKVSEKLATSEKPLDPDFDYSKADAAIERYKQNSAVPSPMPARHATASVTFGRRGLKS